MTICPDLEPHLIFHLHNYCKPCTRPAHLDHRQRPRLSTFSHPQFGYKGKIVLASNTLLKRRVYLFLALRTIFSLVSFFFFDCDGGGLTCNYYKMAHEKDTQQKQQRRRHRRRHWQQQGLVTPFALLGDSFSSAGPLNNFSSGSAQVLSVVRSRHRSHSPHSGKSSRILLLHKM